MYERRLHLFVDFSFLVVVVLGTDSRPWACRARALSLSYDPRPDLSDLTNSMELGLGKIPIFSSEDASCPKSSSLERKHSQGELSGSPEGLGIGTVAPGSKPSRSLLVTRAGPGHPRQRPWLEPISGGLCACSVSTLCVTSDLLQPAHCPGRLT